MTPAGALADFLKRLGANSGVPISLSAAQLQAWPQAFVETLKQERLLNAAAAFLTVVCPGCEERCAMEVQVRTTQRGEVEPFVICDKRNDIGRVPVDARELEAWQASGYALAQWLAQRLDLHPSFGSTDSGGRWELGLFRGRRNGRHLRLEGKEGLRVVLGGHNVPLVELLQIGPNGLELDRARLMQCADEPLAGSDDRESTQVRNARILQRIAELKSKGVRNFIKVVAKEEELSETTVKDIVRADKVPKGSMAQMASALSRTAPAKKKNKR